MVLRAFCNSHYRKLGNIHRLKPMNLTTKSTKIAQIHRLTDESTNKRNSNEFKLSYSSVPMNLTIYSSVTYHQ
jgi:hypothetical protein